MLDELDKLGSDSAATPPPPCSKCSTRSRQAEFRDHYLEVPFDLSAVLFIATANLTDTIPPALRDRMEIMRAVGLYRRGEAGDRPPLPGAAPDWPPTR